MDEDIPNSQETVCGNAGTASFPLSSGRQMVGLPNSVCHLHMGLPQTYRTHTSVFMSCRFPFLGPPVERLE